jgi:cobaltochelatase CobS subunit
MSTHHKALLEAWGMSGRERRKALRSLAYGNLQKYESMIRAALDASPIVGDGEHQIAMPYRTEAGLRDLLDAETLLAVAFSQNWVERVVEALRDPGRNGFISKTSKTGFVFGRPGQLDHEKVNAILAEMKKTITTTTGEDDMGLASTLATFDKLKTDFDGVGDAVIVEAMAQVVVKRNGTGLDPTLVGTSLTKALAARVKEDAGEPHVVDADLYDRARAVLIENGWAFTGGGEAKAEAKALRVPGASEAGLIDLALRSAGLPSIASLIERINGSEGLGRKVAELETQLKAASSIVAAPAVVEVDASLGVPSGRLAMRKAAEAFGITRGKDAFDFNVPSWEWEHPHPHVPAVDADYIFRPFELLRVLWALNTNEKSWLYGHTGTGKSTLVEQVCARLNYPMLRVNFDSEITRLDLVGREVLRQEEGATVSEFVDGILPMAMSGPYVLCLDEIDYVRPDVAYVLQRGLEDKGLLLTEDGGRLVRPHSMFRIFATGNTQGQGDEYGMYAGARQQSMAFLDRFTNWVRVDYLTASEREQLVAKKVPALSGELRRKLVAYSTEHLTAFTGGKVMLPLSPRGLLACAKALAAFTTMIPESVKGKAVAEALGAVVLDRATPQDRAVLSGLVDRVFK